MKRLIVLLGIINFALASALIPFEKIEDVAQNFVNQRYGFHYLDEVLTYYGIDDLPSAYAMVYKHANGEPLTIVMGARLTCTPISEFSKALPNYYKNLDKAKAKAKEICRSKPSFDKIYYFGPQEEYFLFTSENRKIFINTYSLNVLDKEFFVNIEPKRNVQIESILRGKWDRYFSGTDFKSRYTGYVDSVPFVVWSYGCSPTAASMVLWYWDSRGYGRLVDHFFDRWDPPESGWDYNRPNVIRELAIGMYTDSMSGSTSGSLILTGYMTTANNNNGYSFTGQNYGPGNAGNQYCFSNLKNEIDNQRPFHWSVYNHYPQVWPPQAGHSLAGVGYDIILPDTFVVVHNTWDTSDHSWNLWTYHDGIYSSDYVRTVIPGGANSNNIFLTSPQGSGYMFKSLKYQLEWETVGSSIDHVKIWYSIGRQVSSYDSLYWTLVEDNVPNTGTYIWTVPDQDSAFRINISAMNSGNTRLAADGSIYRNLCDFPDHTSNLNLIGHFDTPETCHDVLVIGDYAYVADGANGLVVVDIATDPTFPEQAGHLPLPGNSIVLSSWGSNLYLLDEEDTLRVISISTPTSPTQTGKCVLGVDLARDIFANDTLVYVAGRGSGVYIFNVANPSSPALIGSYNTPGQAYAVLVSDTLAYVGDGVKGLRVLNIADPTDPSEIGFYDTNGITQGLALDGALLYLAEGAQGIKIFNVSDPTDPQQLSLLSTGGTAKSVLIDDSLFVANGFEGGIRVIDVSDSLIPVEVGYIQSFGTATNLVHIGSMLYLADGSDGLYIITENVGGIAETMQGFVSLVRLMTVSPQIGHMRFGLGISATSDVVINIYDVSGRLFESINRKGLSAGEYEFRLSPDVSGVYFIQAKTDKDILTRKVVFLR